jgi:tryptophan synthase beta chain
MNSPQENLTPDELPKKWYNIVPDLEKLGGLPPPKDPEDGHSRIDDLPKILSKGCLEIEMSKDSWIPIPEEVRESYLRSGRPRPLFEARGLERKLGLKNVRIFYKSEFFSPPGSHKVNTAIPQCYYAKKQGFKTVVTETGAGQWGTALAYATSLIGDLNCIAFWVGHAYDLKRERLSVMRGYGAKVFRSPSKETDTGRDLLKKKESLDGSLGIAISEAIEYVLGHEGDSIYCLGSVLNHVMTHQSIIGLETKEQLKMFDVKPTIIAGCLGGGSNFGGMAFSFVKDVLDGKAQIRFIAGQSEGTPNLNGEYRYDFADHSGHTPMLKMYTLGHQFDGKPIMAEGLRYHGVSPIWSLLRYNKLLEAVVFPVDEELIVEAASLFMKTEGFITAPESSYGIRVGIDEALKADKEGRQENIVINVSGHGNFDLEFLGRVENCNSYTRV